jgi:TraX protein
VKSVSEIFSRIDKYGALNTHDVIKLVALIIMTIDHVGAYLLPDELGWRMVGRMTFPVWFFLVGYARNTRIGTELLWGMVILMAVGVQCYYPLFPLNALASIAICRLLLRVAERFSLIEKRPIECFVVMLFLNIPLTLFWEYGMIAVMFAFGGRMVRLKLRNYAHGLFWIFSTLAFLVWQKSGFGFNEMQMVFVTVTTSIVCYYLYHYEQAEIRTPLPRALDVTAKLFSRYSLQYYVLHRVVLQVIGTYVLHTHPLVARLFYD